MLFDRNSLVSADSEAIGLVRHQPAASLPPMRLLRSVLLAIAVVQFAAAAFASGPAQPELLPGSAADKQALALLAQMTLDEKIGQMTQPDLNAMPAGLDDVRQYAVGSVLSGGGSDPKAGNSPTAWADVVDLCQD